MSLTYGEDKLHEKLERIANLLVDEGKGILCADETIRSFSLMFEPLCMENNEEMRRSYRELLFTTPHLSEYISGVLLSVEALEQKTIYGVPFHELLTSQGILLGVTVDKDFLRIPYSDDEWMTQGLDGLKERCKEFYEKGCRFTRWKCSFIVDQDLRPTVKAIQTNFMAMARYASVAQDSCLVPIVEATLVTGGANFSLERSVAVLGDLLTNLFYLLQEYKVHLAGTLLRVSMAVPGEKCHNYYQPTDIAEATFIVLQKTVPPAVGGITFLSGNHDMEEVTIFLDRLNMMSGRKPWPLTFCFGRPLQAIVLLTWLGMEENTKASQKELWRRAKENSLASRGLYLRKKEALQIVFSYNT